MSYFAVSNPSKYQNLTSQIICEWENILKCWCVSPLPCRKLSFQSLTTLLFRVETDTEVDCIKETRNRCLWQLKWKPMGHLVQNGPPFVDIPLVNINKVKNFWIKLNCAAAKWALEKEREREGECLTLSLSLFKKQWSYLFLAVVWFFASVAGFL